MIVELARRGKSKTEILVLFENGAVKHAVVVACNGVVHAVAVGPCDSRPFFNRDVARFKSKTSDNYRN